jgi:TRAP-type C4-dicarboxylate transport system substrate-binding protein
MARVALLMLTAATAVAALTGCMGDGSDRVGGDSSADTKVLTLLDPFSSGQESAEFNNEVARLSHGTLRVKLVQAPDEGLDYEARAIRAMRHGKADLAFAGTRAFDEFGVLRFRALDAPLLIDSDPLERRVITSQVVAPMLAELRQLGLVGIGVLPGPIRRPLGRTRPLTKPADFRGLSIGTSQSRVADTTMRALGATPRRLPATEHWLPGLDGIERQTQGIEGDKLDEKGSHVMTNVNLWPRALVLFASERAYRALTAEQRRILETAAANVVPKKLAIDRAREGESRDNLCRKGNVTFDSATPAELRSLRRAVEPVYRALERDPGTREAIHAIERLKRDVAAPPAVVPGCKGASGTPASDQTTRLDGVWMLDTDRSAAPPEYFPENWGHWIFVFDRGRFAFTQENKPSCTWGYGRFDVHGNRTSWTFIDGGGIAPSGAYNRPGEFFTFDLSAYRDTLKLTPVKGAISPRNFRDKPWRRVSETPSPRYFSKRCPPPADALRD